MDPVARRYIPVARDTTNEYFSSNRGDGSYDYDCDDSESKYYPSSYSCSVDWWGFACDSSSDGWTGSTPSCGSSGTWGSGCDADWWGCTYSSTSSVTQSCR